MTDGNLFKRPPISFGNPASKTQAPPTPFHAAQEEWDQRIGSARVQAKNWRYAAFASLAITFVTLGAYIYERQDTHVATYVIPVDEYGRPGRIELAGRAYEPTSAQTGYFLADWVRWVRARSPVDPVVNTDNLRRAYNFVGASAAGQMADLGKAAMDSMKTDPGTAVTVDVKTVIQRSPTSYEVHWAETTFKDSQAKTTHWTGLFTTRIQPPTDEAKLRANPLGVFISDFHISQELGQ
jgi:type IV secretion system protein VirB5